MNRYRIATSAEITDDTTREEVFDVDADDFEINGRGGVRVVTYSDDLSDLGRWRRWRLALNGRTRRRVNVAWVPHDSLLSIRMLPEEQPPMSAADIVVSGGYARGGVVGTHTTVNEAGVGRRPAGQ